MATAGRRESEVGMKPRSIAVLAFLTIAAAFFCLPLYILIVTSHRASA